MNTVKIGDKFENKSYDLIEKAIENGELGISKNSAKVFRQKGYYSPSREKEIIFDLAIEIWPKGAERYTLLYLIECKSSPKGHKVPVDDVEEFHTKFNQVSAGAVKGVMITDSKFQSGGVTFAKNKRMMLIEVDKEDNHSIILHRLDKSNEKKEQKNLDDRLIKLIKKSLGIQKVQGLKKLSADQIEKKAESVLREYNNLESSIDLAEFLQFLEKEYELEFDFKQSLETVEGKNIAGYFDVKNNKIFIDRSVATTKQFPFVFGHELGHFFLHKHLKINQEQYNDFEDSEYDLFTDRHTFKNERNWIEWQANKFATALYIPKELFLAHLIAFRKSIGISRPEHIFLDEQKINQEDYSRTLEYLSNYFGASKTAIVYRLEELNLITRIKPKEDMRSILRRTFFE